MKTFLVHSEDREVIHTPVTLRDIAGTTKELMDIGLSSSDKDGTYAKVAVILAEAIAKIRSNVSFNIANNKDYTL